VYLGGGNTSGSSSVEAVATERNATGGPGSLQSSPAVLADAPVVGPKVKPQERRLDHEVVATKKVDFPIEVRAGGSRGSGPYDLHLPYGVAVDVAGRIYVCDTLNHRVQRWAAANDTEPETVAGGNGKGKALSQLRDPRGIVVDASNSLYIADAGNHRVVKWTENAVEGVVVAGQASPHYDRQNNVIGYATCCIAGRSMTHLWDPHGVFVNANGDIYVADTGNNRVQLWDVGSGSVSAVAGSAAPGVHFDATLRLPEGVVVYNNIVYVADTGNNRVMAWDAGASVGTLIAGGNGQGDGLEQLTSPVGVWVDTTKKVEGDVTVPRLFVVDRYNHRVMSYSLLPGLGTAYEIVAGGCLESPTYVIPCKKGGVHYPEDPGPDRIDHLNPSNTNPPVYHFFGPNGVHIGPRGLPGFGYVLVTVADTQNSRVLTWES